MPGGGSNQFDARLGRGDPRCSHHFGAQHHEHPVPVISLHHGRCRAPLAASTRGLGACRRHLASAATPSGNSPPARNVGTQPPCAASGVVRARNTAGTLPARNPFDGLAARSPAATSLRGRGRCRHRTPAGAVSVGPGRADHGAGGRCARTPPPGGTSRFDGHVRQHPRDGAGRRARPANRPRT